MAALCVGEIVDGRLSLATHCAILEIEQGFSERVSTDPSGCTGQVSLSQNPVDLLILAKEPHSITVPESLITRLRSIIIGQADHLDTFLAEDTAPVIANMASDYEVIFAADSHVINLVMVRAGALLHCNPLLGVSQVSGKNRYDYPVHNGVLIKTVQTDAALQIITLALPKCGGEEQQVILGRSECAQDKLIQISVPAAKGLTRVKKMPIQDSSNKDNFDAAHIVIGCGGAVETQEQLEKIESLADKLKAMIGGSKVFIEAGHRPPSCLIGQSGKTISPKLYLALGISGSMHHLSGVKDADLIIAVNNDSDAAIFSMADYSLLGDIHVIVPELTALIKS